jgi:hypothetical protein
MRRVTIAPALVLDEEMYELTRAALWRLAPKVAAGFTWNRFVTRKEWLRIPDVENPQNFDEPWFKAQMTIKSGPPYDDSYRMFRLNLWRSADLRCSGGPEPHSHPWKRFEGHLLTGGYVEDRYEVERPTLLARDPFSPLKLGSVRVEQDVMHQAGQHNTLLWTTFHEVRGVLAPGRTLSLMDCSGPVRREGWGYLDPDTGLYTPNKKSPVQKQFKPMMYALNPHLLRR